jgi:iron complex transport system substrate-binding protein
MQRSTMQRSTALVTALALAFGVAACGSDDADSGAAATDTSTATTTAAASTPDTTASAVETTPTAPVTTAPAATETAGAFPVTIEHKYGETTIDAEPERIVSIGFGEHDGLLALGIVPTAVRDWYGDQPYATWPWAQDELGDATPEVLPSTALNFEQIAALRPDLILGISSGMTDADYAKLSAIAPTVAQPGDFIDYGTPWDVAMEITGRAVGKSAEAAQVIADTEQLFADVVAEHPEFQGATAAVTFYFQDQPGVYGSEDIRSRTLADLGFVIPDEFDELAGDSFFASISAEDLSVIDTDVVIWIGLDADGFGAIRDLPTRPTMRAFREGREIVADELLGGAFSHASALSFEYVIDTLVPELALAVDGDASTAVPSSAAIVPSGSGGDTATGGATDDAEQAAADAWSLAFDSTVDFDAKAAHIEDAEALRGTIEAYTAAGGAMGGISLAPTAVVVDGDAATVTYDVLFGDNVAYGDLTGVISLVDGTWVVSRTEFCSFMASARNACPAG